MANTTAPQPTFKHTNTANYRTPTQNLLKFRAGKWRMTCQTTLKTCCEAWTQVHLLTSTVLTVLTPLLFKELIETSENALLRVQNSKKLKHSYFSVKSACKTLMTQLSEPNRKKKIHFITALDKVSANLLFKTFFYILYIYFSQTPLWNTFLS